MDDARQAVAAWLRRLADRFDRARRDREFAAELDAHLQAHVDDELRSGMSIEEARRNALVALGGVARTREAWRDVRRRAIDELGRDVRYAWRTLSKDRGFTVAAVTTLALCLGANVAIFALLNSVILRALPVHDPEQLVVLSDPGAHGMMNGVSTGERSLFSYHEFEGLRDHATVFSGLFATDSVVRPVPVAAASSQEPSPARALLVSGGYFPVLGVEPLQGRTFGLDVDRAGEHPVAVVSYEFWQRRLNGDPAVIGRRLHIRQRVLDVIGVMPPSFRGITVGDEPDIWLPLTMRAVMYGKDVLAWNPGSITKTMFLQVVGRRRPGLSLATVNAAVNVTYRQILEAEAGTIADADDRGHLLDSRIAAHEGRHGLSELRAQYGTPLDVLMGLVGLLLLLACANVANLLLARRSRRAREIGMRVALGASRLRLVRQLMTEGLLIAIAGGTAGLILGRWAVALLVGMVSSGDTPVRLDVHPDAAVVTFAAGITMLTAVLFSVAPAISLTRVDVSRALRGPAATSTSKWGAGWLSAGRALVCAQVAISLLLIVVAGLFVRSLRNLTTIDLGYEADQMLIVRVNPAPAGYRPAAIDPLMHALTARFSALPGVRAVTLSQNGLFFGRESGDHISIPGRPSQPGQEMQARWDSVGANYFRTIGIPVLKGRDVTERDASGPPVCWINQTMARDYFKSVNPIGERIKDEYPETPYTCEIVGIVADAKYLDVRERTPRRFYVPYFHPIEHAPDATFEIRFAGASSAFSGSVRRAVHDIDATIDPPDITTIARQIDAQIARDRLTARLSMVVGGLAVLLACIGLFGVLSYSVAQRTKELGVRMALGARRSGVVRLVLTDGLVLTLLGIVVGLVVSAAATRVVQNLLYGLTAEDPATFAGATALLLVIAIAASAIPSYRATRVDPMVALRAE